MDIKTAMKRSELFRGLDDNQLQRLTTISVERIYNANQTIFDEGDEGDGFYIIGNGQVSVQQHDKEGVSHAAVYLGEGQSFGEMALIDAAKRSASIVAALDNSSLYYINTDDFIELCKSNTDIGYIMMRNIAQDLSFKLRRTAVSNQ